MISKRRLQFLAALFSTPLSQGGLYFCEVYATPGCDCGRKKQTRIVGGVETEINEYPAMAALVSIRNREVLCGATIIDVNYALTAAHCVNLPGRYASDMVLLVGDHDYSTGNSEFVYLFLNRNAFPFFRPKFPFQQAQILHLPQSISWNQSHSMVVTMQIVTQMILQLFVYNVQFHLIRPLDRFVCHLNFVQRLLKIERLMHWAGA